MSIEGLTYLAQETPKTCRNFIALAMEGVLRTFILSVYLANTDTSQAIMTVSFSTGETGNASARKPCSMTIPVLCRTSWSKQVTGRAQEEAESLSMEVSRVIPLMTLLTDGRTLEPFEDEVHPRLRYTHRGLVGMANNGTKNSNDSQFFITLGEPLFASRLSKVSDRI